MRKLRNYAAEILSLLGCACILYGLSMWSLVVMWICAGIMSIVFGVLIAMSDAKEKANDAAAE